jgi:hypothetical protein
MDRLAGTVQTFPIVMRDGKAYGRLILTCGNRTIRIIAEGDQDLINQVYGAARGESSPSTPPRAAPLHMGGVDDELEQACRILIRYVKAGNVSAIQRIRAIQEAASVGDTDCLAVVHAICDLLAREPELSC